MSPLRTWYSLIPLALAAFACSSSSSNTSTSPTAPGGDTPAAEELDPDDPANQPPHALGTIVLGESHASGAGGRTSPIVSATFVPDAAAAKSCKTKLDAACEILAAPKCTKVKDSPTGCTPQEYCAYDETSCKAVCRETPVCDEPCARGETCILPAGETKARCVESSFDAGPIAFSGTTSSITLYPPYSYEGRADGAPFLAGAELRVQAQGAVGAGFEAFDETFTATKFVQTSPALDKLPRDQVFGNDALPVKWVPGEDSILITLTGGGGTVTCKAKDADGKFDIPRSVIEKAMGTGEPSEASTMLNISVARQRKDVKKDKKTKGEIPGVTIQPEAWVELVTTSIESASFQGCSSGADYQNDSENCGGCGKKCGSGQVCTNGGCYEPAAACDVCLQTVPTTSCKSQWNACNASPACKAWWSCVSQCNSDQCAMNCQTANPGFETAGGPFVDCIQSSCQVCFK